MGIDAGISEMAIASLAVTAVGAGVSAYSAVQQAGAARDAANYQAQVAKNNQAIADQNAQFALQQGQQQQAAKEQQTAQVIGEQRAIEYSTPK